MEIKDLTGGLVRNISPDSLAPTQVQDAQNVTFSEMLGVVKTRRGIGQYGSITYKYATSIFWQSIFTTAGIVAFGGRIDEAAAGWDIEEGYPNAGVPTLWLHDRVVPARLFATSRDYSDGGGAGGNLSIGYSADNAAFLEYGNWLLFSDGNRNYKFNEDMDCVPFHTWTFFWEYSYAYHIDVTNKLRFYFGAFIWASATGDPETSEYWCCFEWEKQQIEGGTIGTALDACTSGVATEIAESPRSLCYPVELGIEPYDTVILAATGAAGVLNGTYSYKMTFVDSAGFESNGNTVSAEVTPSSEQVDLAYIGISDCPMITKRRIYRNENGGATWKRVAEITDPYSTTYTDNVADADLGADIPLTNYMPPPFVALEAHNSLIWGVRAAYPDEVWFCNAKSEWQYFDALNYEEFGVVPKNTRALIAIGSVLIVMQDVDTFLYNTGVQPAVISKAFVRHGIATGRAAFDLGDGVLLGSVIGIQEFNGITAKELTQAMWPLFDADSDDGYRLDSSYLANMRMVSDGDNILLSYTSTGQTANDKTLWMRRNGIVESIIPQGFVDFAIDRETGSIYGLKSDYKVYQLLSGDDDDGTDIDWYFQTKDFAVEYGSTVNAKEGLKAKIDCNPNGGTITVDVYMDGSSVQTRTITGSSRTTVRWRLPDRTFHRISYKVSGSGKQYFYGLVDNIVSGDM